MRNLIIVLGDQLDPNSAAFDGCDKQQDEVWMAEVANESTHVWTHKARIVLFLTAMRRLCRELRRRGFTVNYHALDEATTRSSFADQLTTSLREQRPERMVMVEPGEWRVRQEFKQVAAELGIALELRPDRHFLCSHDEFVGHAEWRKQLRMEYFYREMRRKTGVLMEGDQPVGGKWNLDHENRGTFGKQGPKEIRRPLSIQPDATTHEVMRLVEQRFPDHPGDLTHFDWPVTPRKAKGILTDFIENRLPYFGQYQDAMWTDHTYLYHSRLAAAMNLKLLDPRDVIRAAEDAYHSGQAPLNSVEGFIRQILGWREYVRGVYWRYMPEYLERNAMDADCPLPPFYWTGDTEMRCLRAAIRQTMLYGYAHHIQRLMVTGLFALLWGVDPIELHRWYLAVYVDAVEWVELPNTLGMSQYADGGVMASKPYVATGKYIDRMSNYCRDCRYNPQRATGDDACPFTTLYWDFLVRHQKRLENNPRMSLQLKNAARKDDESKRAIRQHAEKIRERLC